ncbi:hypothetical protein J6X73_00980 [Candidatus Saccharibacteria bacterium]|nr:hypothetical protein [Candidatus Saccharibacteria bacterium]
MRKVIDGISLNCFKENCLFLAMICLVFIFGMYGLVKMPRKSSVSENRNLTQFSHFTVKNFLNGKFQDNFENALSDQFAFSEKIRVMYGEALNNLPTYNLYSIACKNRYVQLDGKTYTNMTFNCEDYIVPPAINDDSKQKRVLTSGILEKNIARYNHVNSLVDTYYYYFDEPQIYNFQTGEKVIDLEAILKEKLAGEYTLSRLNYDGYEGFKEYFYKTDHHWNYTGSYQAFQDIAKMFGVKNPAEPTGTFTSEENFYGSKARDSRNHSFKENFTIYTFDLPAHDTYVNHKEREYGHYEDFMNHNYKSKQDFNYYGWVYGGDMGEVVFDYHQPKKDNLLIISNSFDNPVNVLVAQYFNKTYAVDLRHYKDHVGEKFVLSEYIKEKKIDKVLFIMGPRILFDEKSNQGLEL